MPRKSVSRFTARKKGRGGDGRGGCGRGRGGWLGRAVDSQDPVPEPTGAQISTVGEEEVLQSNEQMELQNIPLEAVVSSATSAADRHEKAIDVNPGIGNEISSKSLPACQEFLSTILKMQERIQERLPPNWISICDESGVNVLMMSRDVEKTTQRRVCISYSGSVTISVHRKKLSDDVVNKLFKIPLVVSLQESSIEGFVNNLLIVLNEVRKYEVCSGCDHLEYQELWQSDSNGFIDSNPYGETRYNITYRSLDCPVLILPSKWRCKGCYNVGELLRKKFKTHSDGLKSNAPNINLTEAEKLSKLAQLQKEVKIQKRLVDRLQRSSPWKQME